VKVSIFGDKRLAWQVKRIVSGLAFDLGSVPWSASCKSDARTSCGLLPCSRVPNGETAWGAHALNIHKPCICMLYLGGWAALQDIVLRKR
jgi:hypothetical protein